MEQPRNHWKSIAQYALCANVSLVFFGLALYVIMRGWPVTDQEKGLAAMALLLSAGVWGVSILGAISTWLTMTMEPRLEAILKKSNSPEPPL